MTISQLRSTDGTGTLTYLLVDEATHKGAIIDPNLSDVDRIAAAIMSQNVTLQWIIDTHTHVDHVSGAQELRERFGAQTVMHEKTKDKWKIVEQGDKFGIGETLRKNAAITIDRYVNGGDTIALGETTIDVIYTPGHTDNHLTLHVGEALFVGDLLLAGQAGRSDLPGGSAGEQYDSIVTKILAFPDTTKIFPGHDYDNNTFVMLGNEKKTNPFLQLHSREEYIAFVKDFFPPIAEVGPGGHATLQCGTARVVQPGAAFKSITVSALAGKIRNHEPLVLIDVREPEELRDGGAIAGAKNISVRQIAQRKDELPADKSATLIMICRSGARSSEASNFVSTQCGYKNVFNLEGGMLAWTKDGQAVERV